ncbi:MAG: DUF3226 domain-containing protein [Terriglobales bacterium]
MSPFPPQKIEIVGDRLVVGEGPSDTAFFTFLCQVRDINNFEIRNANGNTGFKTFLAAAKGTVGSKLKSVILVADNDETPEDSFQNVRRQIPDDWPHPNRPFDKAHRPGTPHIVIVMLPFPRIGANSHGCLESMLLQAAEPTLAAQTACLNTYSDCIGIGGWNITARDKMRLRCLMSASFPEDPNAGIQYSLKPERGLIPLTHGYFDELVDLLNNFDAWMASRHSSWADWKADQAANAAPKAV